MTFDDVAFALPLEGRRSLPVTTGDGLVVLAMLLFYIEVLKMARLARKTFHHFIEPRYLLTRNPLRATGRKRDLV